MKLTFEQTLVFSNESHLAKYSIYRLPKKIYFNSMTEMLD